MNKQLYILAYDIVEPGRLRQALRCARRYASGGQLSVHECLLSKAEHRQLKREISEIILPEEDRLLMLAINQSKDSVTLGMAEPAWNHNIIYMGA